MRRPLLLTGLLLLIAAAWFFLFQSEAPTQGSGSETTGNSAPLSPGAAAGAQPPPEAAPPSTQEPAVGRTDVRTDATPEGGLAAYAGPWLLIEVVRGEPALPAPNASVWVLTPEQSRQQELMMAFLTGLSVPELLAAHGTAHRADAAGRLRVPLPTEHGLIAAELDDGFVMNEWEPTTADGKDRELQLALAPSGAVEVLVVDESDRPLAGAPVSIRFGDENFQLDFLRAATGADGIARMEHVTAFLQTFSPGADMPCSVALTSPLPEPVAAPLDLEEPPSEPIRLVMPVHGRIEVEARRADGSRPEDGLVVFLSVPRATAEDDDDFFIPGLPGFESIAARTAGGVATFAYVGLGMDFMATAVFADAPEASRVLGRGPERAGESVRLVLAETRDYPVLTGTLLGPDGRPLAGRSAELRIPSQENQYGMEASRTVVTGPDGGFRLAMRSNEMIPFEQPAEFAIAGDAAQGALLAEFRIPPLRAGENPVGELRARAAPVLAAGRVLGADGAPVPGATVCPMRWIQWDEDDPANGQWVENWEQRQDCAADGAFLLHGSAPSGSLRLLAQAPGHLRKEFETTAGTEALVIRLDAGGALRGRVLADPGVPLDDLVLTLIVPGTDPEDDGQRWGGIDADDGDFAFDGLRPGLGTLTISASWNSHDDEPLVRIEGIAVGPGAAADPRLDPIDLRGRLHACRLKVRTEDGAPIEEIQAWLADAPETQFHGRNGEVTVIAPRPPGRLVISAEGFRRATLDATQAEHEVVLRRGPEVVLAVAPGAARFEDVILGVQLVRYGEDSDWAGQARGYFAADGTLRLRVQEPGEYGAIFIAVRGEALEPDAWGFTWIGPEVDGEYERFTIADAGGAQRIALTPPSAARVLEALANSEER
jgi:hypothetical protein